MWWNQITKGFFKGIGYTGGVAVFMVGIFGILVTGETIYKIKYKTKNTSDSLNNVSDLLDKNSLNNASNSLNNASKSLDNTQDSFNNQIKYSPSKIKNMFSY